MRARFAPNLYVRDQKSGSERILAPDRSGEYVTTVRSGTISGQVLLQGVATAAETMTVDMSEAVEAAYHMEIVKAADRAVTKARVQETPPDAKAKRRDRIKAISKIGIALHRDTLAALAK